MQIETHTIKHVLAVHLKGRLDPHSAGPIGEELTARADGSKPRIPLNLPTC